MWAYLQLCAFDASNRLRPSVKRHVYYVLMFTADIVKITSDYVVIISDYLR